MRKLIFVAIAMSLPAAAVGRDACDTAGATERWATAVMEPPRLGETELIDGTQPANRNLVVARQTVTLVPRIRYLAAPITLVDAEGDELAHNVPLGLGAPITTWRSAEGLKHCAIGWQNGLFGGVIGEGHLRWVCLEDRNGDGAFDNAWRPHSRNLGLSFSRLDMPIEPAVATLESAPDNAQTASERATLSERRLERTILVTRINDNSIRIESRLSQNGQSRRIERRDVPLTGPAEVSLSGVSLSVTPVGRGGASIAARGAFTDDGVQLLCDGSVVAIGEMTLLTSFGFPDW